MVLKKEDAATEQHREGWEHGWVSLPKKDGSLVTRQGGRDKVTVEIFKQQYRKLIHSGDKFLLHWGCRGKLKKRKLQRNAEIVLQVCLGEDNKPRVVGWCFKCDFRKALSSIPVTA